MADREVALRPVDAVEVTLAVDNFVEVLMAGQEAVAMGTTFRL